MEVNSFALVFGWVLGALLVFAFRALFDPPLFFPPYGTCPLRCSKHQIAASPRAPKWDCVPQDTVLPLDAPSQTQARLEGWFPPFRWGSGEMWGKLRPLRDPQQRCPELAGARSRKPPPPPSTSFPCAWYLRAVFKA